MTGPGRRGVATGRSWSTSNGARSSTCCPTVLPRPPASLAATLDGLVTKQKNPQLGDLVFPQPANALPSYAGIRIDADGRFQKFMQRWSEYNRANGNVAQWLIGALAKYGVDPSTIPADIQF
jgi:hypothetical protein